MAFLPRKSIVVPTDLSDESFKALDVALEIAENPSDIGVVLVISDDAVVLEPGFAWGVVEGQNREAAEKALVERVAQRTAAKVDYEVRIGDAGTEIVEYAAAREADLIIMPSHGRRGLNRILMGSVAERVLRLAHCPVMILRGMSSQK